MSLNIQTSTGLLEIGGNVTKDKVISALGYSPANEEIESTVDTHIKDTDAHVTSDERELWNTNVQDLNSHISDKTVHVTSEERVAWNNKSDFSGAYADLEGSPNITENESGNIVITDNSGNIIMQVDSDGVTTTNVNTKTIELNGEDLGSRLDSLESISLPNILDDNSGDLSITDEHGNTIVKIDSNGLETTTVTAKNVVINGKDVAIQIDEIIEDINTLNADKNTVGSVDKKISDAIKDENLSQYAKDDDLNYHANNQSNPHKITASQVGLDKVDNTSDADKPVSTAQKEALDNLKSELSESIVSESKEWTVADNKGNIVMKVDESGVATTTVTANELIVDGTNIKTTLDVKVDKATTLEEYGITDAASKVHEHAISDIANLEKNLNSKVEKSYIDEELKKKSDSTHTHDQYLKSSDIVKKADKSELHEHENKELLDSYTGSYKDLTDTPNILDDETDVYNISDVDGNIIFKVDKTGASAINMLLGDTSENTLDVKSVLNNYILNIDETQYKLDTSTIVE